MVGALVAVGQGKMGLEDISARLEVGSSQVPGEACRRRPGAPALQQRQTSVQPRPEPRTPPPGARPPLCPPLPPPAGAGGAWRGYNVAPAKGLCLHKVHYPAAVDAPNALLYPDLPHDEWGRLVVRLPGQTSDEDGG
jgi:hypothetical protein